MAILRVGKIQAGDQALVSDDDGIVGMLVHQPAGPLQIFSGQMRPVPEQG
jgi:hypothetical protein